MTTPTPLAVDPVAAFLLGYVLGVAAAALMFWVLKSEP